MEGGLRLYTLAPNARYRVLDSANSSIDVSLGYEGVITQLRTDRRAPLMASGVGGVSPGFFAPSPTIRLSGPDLGGHGPRVGVVANFYPTERLSFTTEGFYTGFLDIQGEGKRRTEGHAFRFDVGGRYNVYRGLELGAGYRGYLLSIDRATKRSNDDGISLRVDHLYGYIGFRY